MYKLILVFAALFVLCQADTLRTRRYVRAVRATTDDSTQKPTTYLQGYNSFNSSDFTYDLMNNLSPTAGSGGQLAVMDINAVPALKPPWLLSSWSHAESLLHIPTQEQQKSS
jgi:hypothetical protein